MKPSLYLALASAAAIGLLGGTYFASRKGDMTCDASVVAGGADAIGGPFQLVDETGAAVTDRDVITAPSLVYFGYTYCPDVCPTDVARNVEAISLLEEAGKIVTPVFISVDPKRDTPEVLAEWTDYLHPRLIGLTGTEAQILAAAKAYKTYFKVPENAGEDYLVDHMTHSYLMFPKVGFIDFFTREMTAEQIAERTACYIDAAS
ncbi:MAG: hypothetical protein RLZZ528_308 [Pseudomonadota bacterium]